MAMYPERTTAKIIGGTTNAARRITPPWQTEEALLVLLAITAWGNAATNLLFVSPDDDALLQGALDLTTPDNGLVFAINGVGSIALPHLPIRVASYCIIQPAPAANGQIFVSYYWERSSVPAFNQMDIPLPILADKEEDSVRRNRQEAALWAMEKPLNPSQLLRTEPQEMTPLQKKRQRYFEMLTDTKSNQKQN